MAAFNIGAASRALRYVRPSLVTVALIVLLSLLALHLWSTSPPVAAHHHSHSTAATIARAFTFLASWMVMSAAMMLPSAMPLLVLLDRIARNHSSRHEIPLIAALAYLIVWGLVGMAVWVIGVAAEAFLLPRADAQVVSWLAGAGLVAAGLYGLSPMAGACLRACRRPFGFLARHWRGGSDARLQAARIGTAYGISCVGCCVPMLGIMFVVGMANIAIVIAMGVMMKSSAVGTWVAHFLAIALIAAGIAVGFAWVPLSPHFH